MKTIETRGLSAGSLYKLLFIGLLPPIFIFSFACGMASLFGYSTVTFNDHYVYGLKGLVTSILLGIFIPIILSAFLWCLISIGVWIWTSIKKINLTLKD